jgi:hypothetical protein
MTKRQAMISESRKPRDPEDDFDASGAPSEIQTIAARGRRDDVEPSEDADVELPEADTDVISEADTIELLPLPETEYEELEPD